MAFKWYLLGNSTWPSVTVQSATVAQQNKWDEMIIKVCVYAAVTVLSNPLLHPYLYYVQFYKNPVI